LHGDHAKRRLAMAMLRTRKPVKRKRFDHVLEGEAFLPDPARGGVIRDDDVEALGEEFIATVTGGDSVVEDARNEETMDELGGPFLEIDGTLATAAWLDDGTEPGEGVTTAAE
jgi:hypothetical protein